ncbi:hypothetical protein EDD21DRAFT_365920 [Dissophora ornata]|nr:hypothetical protein EDD21DRAFT_365920 [Dissophora ornata]
MTVSPGPMSPNTHMLKMSKYPLSGSSSPALSPSSSIASISSPSCTSSPTLYPSTEFLKEGILGEGYQEIGHLSMTPTDVDVRLQESAPPMELSGPDEYSEYGKVKSRSPTLSPSDGKIAINQRPSRRPETQHNDAALKVNFGMTGPYDIARTTQGVRDEYYSKRSVQSRNISTKSFETCATSQRSENRSAQCSTTNQVYELVGAAARPNSAERPRQQKQVEYDAQSLDKTERHELQMLADGQMKHTQRHRQFNAQQTFQQENSLNASAYAVGVRSYSTSSKTPLIQMNAVPIESRQDPSYNHNGHYIQDLHRMPFQSLSEHRSWPSPSHYQPSQYSMKPRSLTPQSPKLEQTQRASLSCPSSPMASSHLSHISSMKHSRASSNPEFNIVLERVFPQPYRKSHMQTQDPIQFDEEISQRLYNTPLFSKNDGAVDICHDCRPAFTAAIPRPTTQHTMESKYSGKKEYEGSCSNLEVQSGQLSQKATCSDPRHFLHKQWHTEGVHAQRQHRSHETRDTDPVLIAHGETESCLGSMMQPESTQHANQIDQAPCGSHQQPSPQLVCVAEPITNRDEVSAAVIHHENSHINTDKNGQPQSANLTAESVTVASSLQAHSEVVSGGQCQRAGVCHMASRPAVEDSSCIARPLQPNANNPAVERINGSYQTSPLAFEGNMMTANSSPPPPPETARCIADVGESAAPCRTPFVPPLAVDDDLGVGRSSDPKGDH